MSRKAKKTVLLFLCVCLTFCLCGTGVFAAESGADEPVPALEQGTTLPDAEKTTAAPVTDAPGEAEATTAAVCADGEHTIVNKTTVPPTQTEAGAVIGVCERCGASVTLETLVPEAQREESRIVGDVNGDNTLQSKDARLILRSVSRIEMLTPEESAYADMNTDGTLTSKDARLALRTVVKLEPIKRHAFSVEIVTAPTCEGKGELHLKCDYCSEEQDLKLPANGHRFTQTVDREPTCTEKGHMTSVCSVCGYKEERDLPAAGHRFGEPVVVNATCTENGSIVRVCQVCGEREETVLYATGSHQWQEATLQTPKYCVVCGAIETGWTQVGEKWVWFQEDGTVSPGKAVVSYEVDGETVSLFTEDGVFDPTFRGAVSCNGQDWNVTEGIAQPVRTEAERTLFRAFLEVEKATDPSMTKEQKLRACFDYAKKTFGESNVRMPHYTEMDWPILYANDMFVGRTGNCFSYAAAFAYMAKAIGYENVYCCNSGGHGWAEIDGLVYDPEWSKAQNSYTYYALSYDTRTDVAYKSGISAGEPWMHVKI